MQDRESMDQGLVQVELDIDGILMIKDFVSIKKGGYRTFQFHSNISMFLIRNFGMQHWTFKKN